MTTKSKRATPKSADKRAAEDKRSAATGRAAAKAGATGRTGQQTPASGVAHASSSHKTSAVRRQASSGRIVVKGDDDQVKFTIDKRLEAMDAQRRNAIVETVERLSDSFVRNVGPDTDIGQLGVVQAATKNTAEMLLKSLREANEALRKRVDAHRVEPIERAAKTVIGRLVHDAYASDVTDMQLSERTQLAIDAFNVVLSGNRRELESVIDALEVGEPDPNEDIDAEQARARARIRMQAVFRKVLSESLTLSDLKPYYKSRQRLQQLRVEDRVFALKIPCERGLVYPAWQFDNTYEPLPVMPELIRTAKDASLTPLALHQVMTGRRAGGKSGVELLAEGREDLVLGLIHATDRGRMAENAEAAFSQAS